MTPIEAIEAYREAAIDAVAALIGALEALACA